jgi:hypothetical protein
MIIKIIYYIQRLTGQTAVSKSYTWIHYHITIYTHNSVHVNSSRASQLGHTTLTLNLPMHTYYTQNRAEQQHYPPSNTQSFTTTCDWLWKLLVSVLILPTQYDNFLHHAIIILYTYIITFRMALNVLVNRLLVAVLTLQNFYNQCFIQILSAFKTEVWSVFISNNNYYVKVMNTAVTRTTEQNQRNLQHNNQTYSQRVKGWWHAEMYRNASN